MVPLNYPLIFYKQLKELVQSGARRVKRAVPEAEDGVFPTELHVN